jgi:hypothetical protein
MWGFDEVGGFDVRTRRQIGIASPELEVGIATSV